LIRGIISLSESGYGEPVNIGNPVELSLLDMAKTIIELTESRSELVFEPLPIDDPKVRQPDITLAKQILDWEPQVDLSTGLQKTLELAGVERLAR
jgi:dTDP-glucose 4,6-dehydratase